VVKPERVVAPCRVCRVGSSSTTMPESLVDLGLGPNGKCMANIGSIHARAQGNNTDDEVRMKTPLQQVTQA